MGFYLSNKDNKINSDIEQQVEIFNKAFKKKLGWMAGFLLCFS